MKKSILILVAAFTFSSFFTSCRETTTERNDVEVTDDLNDDLDDLGNDIEDAADDVGNSIERAAQDVEDEIEGNDDIQ